MTRVLLVDDRAVDLLVLRAILRKPGRELVEVESGSAAIAEVRASSFDLVVLDVAMRDMDGFETARELRAICPDLPILFVTALADDSRLRRDFQRFDACQWLGKPVDAPLLQRLAENMERAPG